MPERRMSIIHLARLTVGLLSPREQRKAWTLAVVVVLAALIEVASVVTIIPFMSALMGQASRQPWGWMADLLARSGLSSGASMAWQVGLLSIFIVVGSAAFSLTVRHALLHFCHGCYHDLSSRLFARLLHARYAYFLQQHPARLAEAVLTDCEVIASKVFLGLMIVFSNLAVCVGVAVMLLFINPVVALMAAVGVGGMYVGIYGWMHHRVRALGRAGQLAADEQARIVNEALRGIREVQAFGAQPYFLNRYLSVSRVGTEATAEAVALSELPRKLIEALAIGGAMMAALIAVHQPGHATALLQVLALYVFAAYRLLPMAQQIFQNSVRVRFHAPAVERIHNLLHDAALQAESFALPKGRGQSGSPVLTQQLVLDNVSFNYEGERPTAALHGVTLRIQAGQFVGIVGASGSGKSTLIAMLLGLLSPGVGQILADDRPLSEIDPVRWRAAMGYVPQHITLLDDSVTTNIAFGDPNPDAQRVEWAARAACIHDFIVDQLPDAYRTVVGADGVRLSGGERQRLGVARALYGNPSLLILDEATASLDADTEAAVMRNILGWREGRTVIAIAHRHATLASCDVVHVFQGGRLLASGAWPDLQGLAEGS